MVGDFVTMSKVAYKILSEISYEDQTTPIIIVLCCTFPNKEHMYPDRRNSLKPLATFLFSVRTREKGRTSNSRLVLLLVLP
jgi:hypothetical protein